MNKFEMIKWLQNLKKDIGQSQHQDLWHYAEMLDEVTGAIEVNEDAISNGAISPDYIEGYREAVQRLEKFYLGEAKARSVTTEQSSMVGERKDNE